MNQLESISFINDKNVIGKWESFDVVQSEEQLDINNPNKKSGDFHEIYFLPNGQKYWIFEGWTKGLLFIHYGGNDPVVTYEYKIININDSKYMFIKTKDSSNINVLFKTSDKIFDIDDIGVRDNIDLPFVMDENILGLWNAVDYVSRIDDFSPFKQETPELWLKSVMFKSDGSAVRAYGDENWNDFWTKGFLIDKKKNVASAYKIMHIENRDYLFMEWKMGNYVFRGFAPKFYVFTRR